MRVRLTLLAALFVLALCSSQIFPARAYDPVTQPPAKTVPLTVKVVLVGIDRAWIDTNLLVWNELIPLDQYQSVQVTDAATGVLFKLTYDVVFATQYFRDKYVQFLRSVEISRKFKNPWYRYSTWNETRQDYDYTTHDCSNVLYDAMKVEEWLYQNRDDYGGFPTNGWTFLITYLPELPSISWSQEREWRQKTRGPPNGSPHYYSISVTDPDGGYKYRETEFMKGWGGKYRLVFVDLSSGPARWTGWTDMPLQWALEDFGITLGSTFGRSWLTNYVTSYVWEAVRNFAVPNFCYDPPLTDEYELVVHFLDHRTSEEKSKVKLENRVNKDTIKAAYEDLCPHVKSTVNLNFGSTSDFEGLAQIIEDSRLKAESYYYSYTWTKGRKLDYINMDPVYKYLQNNIGKFVKDLRRDRNKVTIPVFVFVFSSSICFYSQWKHYISYYDRLTDTFGGVALGDYVMIGVNQNSLTVGDRDSPKQPGKGIGFTALVIHEVGHMVGLMHPHSYAWWGDFALGAMSYFTNDVVFSQHDKDALRRNHVDKLMIEAGQQLGEAKIVLGTRVKSTDAESLVAKAEQSLRTAESDYAKMQYAEAFSKVKDALTMSKAALEKANTLTELSGELERTKALLPVVLIVGIVIGAGVGFVFMKVLMKKKESVPKTVA